MATSDFAGAPRCQILIVDDESTIRSVLARVLGLEGFECHTADSVDSALEALLTTDPEVVICDIRMPDRDGTDLLSEMRIRYPEIAVIMLTGHGDVDLAVRCLNGGASDFLTKPVRGAHLATAVARARERRRLILENRAYARDLEHRIHTATQGLEQALKDLNITYDMTLAALASAVDAREVGTGQHSRRVTRMSMTFADRLGLPAGKRKDLSRGALLHDIGKIGIPDSILLKPGKLTTEEMAVMKNHPEIGYKILEPIPFLAEASVIVRHHHENFDGSGYPAGLVGREIPWGARIFAVADALDAMTSDRPYRKAPGLDHALRELNHFSKTQFDPEIISMINQMGKAEVVSLVGV
ncbi:MAG: two-component system response regulator [Acidobacteria bacterium]|nr:MAG: two-component system response regulator [Acidobacteriota bacterium]RLE36451.1 MAG: two-component system response regulator [Acidobacteriota bacterium]